MSEPAVMATRHVDERGNCSLCGGTHYGSIVCPFRCDTCGVNVNPCDTPGCPKHARYAAERARADARPTFDRNPMSLQRWNDRAAREAMAEVVREFDALPFKITNSTRGLPLAICRLRDELAKP